MRPLSVVSKAGSLQLDAFTYASVPRTDAPGYV